MWHSKREKIITYYSNRLFGKVIAIKFLKVRKAQTWYLPHPSPFPAPQVFQANSKFFNNSVFLQIPLWQIYDNLKIVPHQLSSTKLWKDKVLRKDSTLYQDTAELWFMQARISASYAVVFMVMQNTYSFTSTFRDTVHIHTLLSTLMVPTCCYCMIIIIPIIQYVPTFYSLLQNPAFTAVIIMMSVGITE